jgi:hypothetical protein
MVVSNSYCGVCFVLFFFFLCMVVSNSYCGVNKTHTTIAVGDHHTQEDDKQSKTHNTIAVGHNHTQEEEKQNKTHTTIFVLCMVVFNSYCGVFCFVCLRLVHGGVQQLLWCVLCFVWLPLVHGGVQQLLWYVFCFVNKTKHTPQ